MLKEIFTGHVSFSPSPLVQCFTALEKQPVEIYTHLNLAEMEAR